MCPLKRGVRLREVSAYRGSTVVICLIKITYLGVTSIFVTAFEKRSRISATRKGDETYDFLFFEN